MGQTEITTVIKTKTNKNNASEAFDERIGDAICRGNTNDVCVYLLFYSPSLADDVMIVHDGFNYTKRLNLECWESSLLGRKCLRVKSIISSGINFYTSLKGNIVFRVLIVQNLKLR